MIEIACYVVACVALSAAAQRFGPSEPLGARRLLVCSAAGACFLIVGRWNDPYLTALILAYAAIASATDLRWGVILDATSAPVAMCAAVAIWQAGQFNDGLISSGAALAPVVLVFAVTRARGIGLGDVKFVALLGLLLPVGAAALIFPVACVMGALYGLCGIALGRMRLRSRVAFAPFLVCATFLCHFSAGFAHA